MFYVDIIKDVNRILQTPPGIVQPPTLFRGESECFCKISSKMYRFFEPAERDGYLAGSMEDWLLLKEREIIEHVKAFDSNAKCKLPDTLDSFGSFKEDAWFILGDVQQAGGITNFIDFTWNINVALFFACNDLSSETKDKDGRLIKDKDGRLIVFSFIPGIEKQHHIIQQRNTGYSKPQSAVFVRPYNGGLLDENNEMITIIKIPAKEKEGILRILKRFYHIDYHTIFNDFRGYIRNQKLVFPFI